MRQNSCIVANSNEDKELRMTYRAWREKQSNSCGLDEDIFLSGAIAEYQVPQEFVEYLKSNCAHIQFGVLDKPL